MKLTIRTEYQKNLILDILNGYIRKEGLNNYPNVDTDLVIIAGWKQELGLPYKECVKGYTQLFQTKSFKDSIKIKE